jgi:glycosyltransferase involved in cell wall biosynthesis
MRVAYLTNQYPAVSHSFIRREILALEARGNTVFRYAIDFRHQELVDPADFAERAKTKHVLRMPLAQIATSFVRTIMRRPTGALRALGKSFRIGYGSERGIIKHLIYLIEAAVIADWCIRDKVEHLHVHFGTNPAVIAILLKAISGVPYSLTVHGPEEFDCPRDLALSQKIEEASFVIAVSFFGRSQLMRWVGAEQWHKIHVVHCGIDVGYYPELPQPASTEPIFVCVARFAEQKGHHILLEAAAKLRKQGLEFQVVLAGDGPLRTSIEHRIAKLGLGDYVRITGWISGEQVQQEIKCCRAFVLPSFAEGLPVALMEAMALGRPVVSTYIAGIPELVVSGLTGWLVPAGDAESLAQMMREALSTTPERWMRMGAAARKMALERHDIAYEVVKIEHLMRKAINEHSGIAEPMIRTATKQKSSERDCSKHKAEN